MTTLRFCTFRGDDGRGGGAGTGRPAARAGGWFGVGSERFVIVSHLAHYGTVSLSFLRHNNTDTSHLRDETLTWRWSNEWQNNISEHARNNV